MVWTFGEAPFTLAGSRIPDGQARSAVDNTDYAVPTRIVSYFVMFLCKSKLM